MGVVFIYALDANSGASWMFQAPNLHLVMQLLRCCKTKTKAIINQIDYSANVKPFHEKNQRKLLPDYRCTFDTQLKTTLND